MILSNIENKSQLDIAYRTTKNKSAVALKVVFVKSTLLRIIL